MINKDYIAIIRGNWKNWAIYAILFFNILWQIGNLVGYAIEGHYIFFEFRGILNDLDSSMYEMGINNVKLIYGWLCRDALLNTGFAIFAFIVYRHTKAKTTKQ